MKSVRKYFGILVLYLIAIGLLTLTNPQHINPVLLIVPLLIFFFAVFLTVIAVLRGVASRHHRTVSRTAIIITAALTALPVVLLLLQSIGQLSARDVITIVLLITVLSIYISKFGLGRH